MFRNGVAVVCWCWACVLAAALVGPATARETRSPAVPTSAPLPAPPTGDRFAACQVTQPNGNLPASEGIPGPGGIGGFGNEFLWTNVWMWGEGTVPVPTTHVLPDGAFGEMKWAWYRYASGRLTVEGRRLDAPAPPLWAWIPDGYGDSGFQVTGLIFPTGGCWEVTGKVGEASLTFITLVVPPATVDGSGGMLADGGGEERNAADLGRADT